MAKIPGGSYTAEFDVTDGTYTIKNVPIMAELPKGARQNTEFAISTGWFQKAILRHQMLERQQGYLAPVHTNHHDLGRETERAAFLRLSKVGSVAQNGVMVPALFADIVGLSEEHFARIQANDLPYRSVEIATWDDGHEEISSLALLSDESPWFKLPMMSVGEIVASEDSMIGSCAPLVAMQAHGKDRREMLLFRFMDKDETKMSAEQMRSRRAAMLQENGDNGNGKKDDDSQDDDAIKLQEGTEEVSASVAAMIADFQAQIPDLVRSYLDGLTPGGGAEDLLEEEPLDEDTPAPVELQEDEEDEDDKVPVPPLMKVGDKNREHYSEGKSIMLAELAGRVAALETDQANRQQDDDMTHLIEKTTDNLRSGGWIVPDSAVIAMRQIAEDAKNPRQSVEKFAESYRMHATRDPVSTFAEFDGKVTGDPADVAKFAEHGPGTLERARQLAQEYDHLKSGGFNFTVTREDHIRENIAN